MWEWIKVIFLSIIEGITEWLPVSSTGHLILANEFVQLQQSEAFVNMFEMLIQLGAIMAVVVLFWRKLWPFCIRRDEKGLINRYCKKDVWQMWFKVAVACVPAVIGIIFDDEIDRLFYNPLTVMIMLAAVGVLFLAVEAYNQKRTPKVQSIDALSYKTAFIIGVWQLLALLPGTSRSGATIIGALLLGVSRPVAAEFTFFLAIPAMVGKSALELVKFGGNFTGMQAALLLTGMAVSFAVSLAVIRFLMNYVKKHDFRIFGWYRIALAAVLAVYFFIIK